MFQETEYNKRFDISLWNKLLRLVTAKKGPIVSLIIVMVIVALIDAAFPLLNKYAIDHFIVPAKTENLANFIWIFAGIIVLQAFNVYLLIAIAGKIDMDTCYTIRKNAFKRLQELSFSYYDKTPVGWIMARMTSDSQKLGDIIAWGLVDSIWGGTMMIAIAIILLIMHWQLGLIVLTVTPILVLISLWFQKRILNENRVVRKTNSKISGAYNEGIIGAKTTKTLLREDKNYCEFKALSGKMRLSSIRTAVFSSVYLPIVLTCASIGTGLTLWFGGSGVFMGAITYGTLVAFLGYTVQFFEPVRELARVLAEFQAAQASAERLISLIETKPEVKDRSEVIKKFGTIIHPQKANWPKIAGEIEFRNVGFSYHAGEIVLKNFNLKIKAGQTVALVGNTGSGKSTIVNLLCRFYEPSNGSILIDGVDYRKRSLQWLHTNIGFVLQSTHLFRGTIIENILYGKEGGSRDEAIKAAQLVNAEEFILKTEHGYDSKVGEGGTLLSAGEKQLITFARAVLVDPPLFILDEATSAIDTETEMKIQTAIGKILENRTSFVIAHRLSTIQSADLILVIAHGTIKEKGNHHTLMAQKGYYYQLFTNQFVVPEQEYSCAMNG